MNKMIIELMIEHEYSYYVGLLFTNNEVMLKSFKCIKVANRMKKEESSIKI